MRLWLSVLALVACSTAVIGCHSHDDRTIVSAISDTSFYLSYEDVYETEEQDFFWNTTLIQGQVVLRVTSFHHGSVRVRIYDDLGIEIYDEFAHESYYHGYGYDDEITIINVTEPANPGTWRIRVSALDFTGHLYLNIDPT